MKTGRTALLDNPGKFWKEEAKEIPRIVQTLVEEIGELKRRLKPPTYLGPLLTLTI